MLSGRLFIIATPIGNLGDLTERAKVALADCNLILAEDTRVTIKLLNHLGLKKKMLSCHDFNERQRIETITKHANQSIALVSDAGSPLVSDPGYLIVQTALQANMQVIPIPGASAFLLALIGSGIPMERFIFEGFLPKTTKDRMNRLDELKQEQRTMVFYISTHDLEKTLPELLACFGDRKASLARELTKLHEEFVRGSISHLIEVVNKFKVKGEYVLVIEGAKASGKFPKDKVLKQIGKMLEAGEHLKDAASFLAKDSGWTKSELYQLGLEYRKQYNKSS